MMCCVPAQYPQSGNLSLAGRMDHPMGIVMGRDEPDSRSMYSYLLEHVARADRARIHLSQDRSHPALLSLPHQYHPTPDAPRVWRDDVLSTLGDNRKLVGVKCASDHVSICW